MIRTLQAYAGSLFKEGTTEWSLSMGYGRNLYFKELASNVSENIKPVPFLVSWSKVFMELRSDASIENAAEGIISYIRQESKDAYLAGVTPLLIYNFTNHKKLTPYVDAGIGFVVTNVSAEGFGGDWGLTPQAGIGFRYAIKDDQFIRFSYRYHHISNAGLKSSNKSIDSNYFFVGYSFVR